MISVHHCHVALQTERTRLQRAELDTDFIKGMLAGLNLATAIIDKLYEETKYQPHPNPDGRRGKAA